MPAVGTQQTNNKQGKTMVQAGTEGSLVAMHGAFCQASRFGLAPGLPASRHVRRHAKHRLRLCLLAWMHIEQ